MTKPRESPLPNTPVRRRDFLRAVTAGIAVASVASASLGQAAAGAPSTSDKRRARYRANSPEVQTFYRVNRYPGQ
jgi:hypothetical protein